MNKVITALVTIILITGCQKESANKKFAIAAASSMKHATEMLVEEFVKTHPGLTIDIIPSASDTLTAQILNGAPYDIFLAADMERPGRVYDRGFAVKAPVIYARGRLILFSKKGIRGTSRAFLSENSGSLIAIANPRTAPYGTAAIETLKNMGIGTPKRLITTENVMQAASLALGSADAGLISMSALYTPAMKKYRNGKYWVEIDPVLHSPIEHGMVILKNGRGNKPCGEFHNFVLSPKGKSILKENGFGVD
ncbi:MAG: molybdate ABC transporter substrate-binding protein [Spirochaetes bacterium]|nr:molybdate ABC transporter substrate-binding protein [Spirochaetota bacterium]